jgi:hypothetical protein
MVISVSLYMTIDEAVKEWESKPRRMGCNSAADWFCCRVDGFRRERLKRWTSTGELFEHVVATDGKVRVDLSPYADRPSEDAEGEWK